MITNPMRDMLGNQYTTITTTSETTIVTAAGTGISADLYSLVISNTSSTYTYVTIKDSTGGTVRMTLSVPPQETRGFALPSTAAITQASPNNNWTATCSAAVTSINITALFTRSI